MNKFTNINVLNEIKSIKKLFIISFVFLLIGGALIYLGINNEEKENKKTIDLETLIQTKDKSLQNTYIEVNPYAYQFAVYDGLDESYYIVSNDKYYYVAYMKDSNATKLNTSKEEKIKITGVAKVPSKDIKKLALEVINETITEESEKLTLSDYDNYFGSVYIDLTDNIDNGSAYYLFGVFSLIIFLIIFIIALYKRIAYKISLNKIPDDIANKMDMEMNTSDAFYYKRTKLYLTKNYVINFQGKFCYTEYKDIYWLYPYEFRYNGIPTNKAIKIFTKDAKTRVLANVDAYSKKSKEVYEEIWNTLIEKNDKMLIGYTKDNIKQAKEYKKNLKNSNY